jgi:hypothetical protein
MARAQPINDSPAKPTVAPAVVADVKHGQVQVPTPERTARGRQQAKPRDKINERSASHSHTRRAARQPSPPNSSSQAEVAVNTIHNIKQPNFRSSQPINTASVNTFDPFLDSDSDRSVPSPFSLKPAPVRPTPIIATRPNGTLASRRKARGSVSSPATPTHRKTLPVPVPMSLALPNRNAHARPVVQLSRSEPYLSHMPVRASNWDEFPICDDTTEYGDDDYDVAPSPPTSFAARSARVATGRTALNRQYDDGPRTAPLSLGPSYYFPAQHTSSPRKHGRTPSEGVFHLSDDDSSSGSLKGLLTINSPNKGMKDKDGKPFFASSMFQISPNPEELPPPSFGPFP